MSTGIFKALFLTLLFILLKLPLEILIVKYFGPADLIRGSIYSGNLFKLLLSISFLFPVFLILLVHSKIFRKQALTDFIQKISILPGKAFPTGFLPLAAFLPLALQILGTRLDSLNQWLFECDSSYDLLLKYLAPTGHILDSIGAVLTIGVIGPFVEEIFFRGYILTGLQKHYKNVWIPILIQAVLFGLSHMNQWQALYSILAGVYFGYLKNRTGSLFIPFLIHAGNNLLFVLLPYFEDFLPFKISESCNEYQYIPLWLTAASAVILLGSILYLEIFRHMNKSGNSNSVESGSIDNL